MTNTSKQLVVVLGIILPPPINGAGVCVCVCVCVCVQVIHPALLQCGDQVNDGVAS